jgi:hypothetical protein
VAGGIDWFRWHHGSVTDPKFKVVARKAGARLGDVLAVWAFLLEQASASEKRGSFGVIDCESIDCLLDMEDGAAQRIVEAMQDRNLVEDGTIAAWDKRQPKRERDDPNAAERQALKRDRDSQSKPSEASDVNVTPCHATSHQKTPILEKRREEKKDIDKDFGFASFWSVFPNKKAKADAFKAWSKLKPCDALQASILKAVDLQRQGEDWRKEGGRFIPHPATWLNGRRWEDATEPPEAAQAAFVGVL